MLHCSTVVLYVDRIGYLLVGDHVVARKLVQCGGGWWGGGDS